MRFRVNRASFYSTNTSSPCEGAIKSESDTGWVSWYVDIPDLAALMAMVKREGQLIVGEDSIWIYDDYME